MKYIKLFEQIDWDNDPYGEDRVDPTSLLIPNLENDEEIFNFIKSRNFIDGIFYQNMGYRWEGSKKNAVLTDNENYSHQFGFYSDVVVYRIKNTEYSDRNINWRSNHFIKEFTIREDNPGFFKKKITKKIENYVIKKALSFY